MKTEKEAGKLIGVLLLLGFLLSMGNNFGLTNVVFSEAGWMKTGSQMPMFFSISAMLGLITSFIMLFVAILAFPILRQSSPSLALAYLILGAIVVATTSVEMANFLSMRTLSIQFAKHPGLDPAMFEVLRSMAGGNRHWLHHIDKLMGGTSMLVFCLALYRSNLMPRIIPAIGVIAAPIQMTGITLTLFMVPLPMIMLAPIALSVLAISLTLIIRGFEKPKAV
jgi:hypothetical protein